MVRSAVLPILLAQEMEALLHEQYCRPARALPAWALLHFILRIDIFYTHGIFLICRNYGFTEIIAPATCCNMAEEGFV